MINAERLVLLDRARSDLLRVRKELDLASLQCPRCGTHLALDPEASRLDRELAAAARTLEGWVVHLSGRSPTTERVSAVESRDAHQPTTTGVSSWPTV